MTNRIKKLVAAAALAVSLGGGGTLIDMIATTADAGMPMTEWCHPRTHVCY